MTPRSVIAKTGLVGLLTACTVVAAISYFADADAARYIAVGIGSAAALVMVGFSLARFSARGRRLDPYAFPIGPTITLTAALYLGTVPFGVAVVVLLLGSVVFLIEAITADGPFGVRAR